MFCFWGMNRMKYQKAIVVLFIVLMVGVVLYQHFAYPKYAAQDSALEDFSSENAYRHLEHIAQQPRRMYQPYYNQARDYVIDELKKLGIESELQKTTSLEPRLPIFYSSVENIIARIEGTSHKDDAILLVAHLDSEPFVSPGAGDNGGGVASFLELARAVKSSERLQNDLTLLFSVPEEPGMQGVTAFITEHPLAKKTKIVFNCDGMGTGHYLMQNTSVENSWLIGELAKACPSLQAYSFISFADPLPSKDGTIFKQFGYPVMDLTSYYSDSKLWHTKHDNFQRISLAGLQENGAQLLSLVRHFGNINLEIADQHGSVYFSVLNLFIAHYQRSLILPCSLVVLCLSILLMIRGIRKGEVNGKGSLYAFVLLIVGGLVAIGLVRFIFYLITEFHPMYQFLFNDAAYNRLFFYLGFVGLSFLTLVGVLLIGYRKLNVSRRDLDYGVLVFLNVVVLTASFINPDVASMIAWVLLMLQILLFVRSEINRSPSVPLAVAIAYSSVAIALILPMMIATFLSNDEELLRYLPAVVFSVALLPVLCDALLEKRKIFVSFLGVATLTLLVVPLADDFDFEKPRVTYVSCISDADRGKSLWLVRNLYKSDFDDYSKQFLREGQRAESIRKYIPDYPYDYSGHFTEMDSTQLAAPTLEVESDSVSKGFRYLKLRVKSSRNAWEMVILKNPELDVIKYAIDGVPCKALIGEYTKTDSSLLCVYRNLRNDGLILSMTVKADEKIALKLKDKTYGIPIRAGMRRMSEAMIPWVDYDAHKTSVIKTFTL